MAFDESKHPRKGDGRFTDSGNGGIYSKYKNSDLDKALKALDEVEEIRDSSPDSYGSENTIDNLLGKEFIGFKRQAAIDKLMQEKQGYVKNAFHRDDIGNIDLLWGNEYLGLQHIIAHREAQGIDAQGFVKDLAEVIEKGNYRKKNDRGNFEFIFNGKVAVISPELRGNKITFLLTAFKTHSKK